MGVRSFVLVAGAAAGALCAGPAGSGGGVGPIPFPHPQITEVLFNVPPGSDGDADGDGTRDAVGDEFIEIANPHGSPVNLKGYVLHNRKGSFAGNTGKGVRFEFPDAVLAPHAAAVVFNGLGSTMDGPVGTEAGAPESGHAGFGGALVFTMGNTSKGVALANGADWVVLCAPDGTVIDCVVWGEPDVPPPGALRVEHVDRNPKGSVQRLGPDGALEAHREINGRAHSPGRIPRRAQPTRR